MINFPNPVVIFRRPSFHSNSFTIIWEKISFPLQKSRLRDHQNHYFGAWITYFKELISRARGFLWGDTWKWLDVLISVHNWIIEIVENTLPRKLLWEKFENLNCFDFAWAYGLTWTHRDSKGITTNSFIKLFRVVLNSDKTKLN